MLQSIFDPLDLISLFKLIGKDMYRQACDLKLPQDSELITFLLKNWIKWSASLPQQIDVPRAYRYSIIQ